MGLITIKTDYSKKLDSVFTKLCEGRERVAKLKDNGIDIVTKDDWGRRITIWATEICCNANKLEIRLAWTPCWKEIDRLTASQQDRIVKAIDWSTLG